MHPHLVGAVKHKGGPYRSARAGARTNLQPGSTVSDSPTRRPAQYAPVPRSTADAVLASTIKSNHTDQFRA